MINPLKHQTSYEQAQDFNALTRWLHSFRYRKILQVFAQLKQRTPNRALRVTEIGCAHAKLFDLLRSRVSIEYTGIELEEEFVEVARERYGSYSNFRIVRGSAADPRNFVSEPPPDIVIALECLEHIPEREVVRVVEVISRLRPAFFVCSVPVEVGPAVWLKNVGSLLSGYMRHKEYTWPETFWAGL
jgi:2-polyprenyl-3-methyl-5-hydroxy-6-metoxy-1,4-benzoquinol methylase